MNGLVIVSVARVGCAIIDFCTGYDGERGESAFMGAVAGGAGCIQILLYIFFTGISIAVIIWLFSALF